MDSHVERRFGIGPFASEEQLRDLAIEPPPMRATSSGWDLAPHALVADRSGLWLCTHDAGLRDRAATLLGSEHVIVTIDCWNSFAEGATSARFRVERHRAGSVETEYADRRWSDLARAGGLPAVTADWLAQKIRSLARASAPATPSKREFDHRERAERFLELLSQRGVIELEPGSALSNLEDRTRRILFSIARTRADAIALLEKMLMDSKHVAEVNGDAGDLRAALDEIRYRR